MIAKCLVVIVYALAVLGMGWFLVQLLSVVAPDFNPLIGYAVVAIVLLPVELKSL